MWGFLLDVFKSYFLLSGKTVIGLSSEPQVYLRWYEWWARGTFFLSLCVFGLLRPFPQLVDRTIQALANTDEHVNAFSPLISALIHGLLSNRSAVLLAAITVTWHFSYLRHLKHEISIIDSCFDNDRKPRWTDVAGAKYAPFIGIWLFLGFAGLCLLVSYIQWYALIAIVLNIGDLAANEFAKNNILTAFRSARFRTKSRTLLKRRRICLEYWSERWHLTRILIMLTANLLALTIANSPFGIRIPDAVAYAVVLIAIVANEYIITTWRIERDDELGQYPVSPRRSPPSGRKIQAEVI